MSNLTKKLNELLEIAIQNGDIAGANLLVIKDGKEVAYTEAGYASIEKNRLFKRDTICRIYSMSKPITSAAAMILVERGELELGQPVSDILEEFKNQQVWEGDTKVPARRSLLVRDLLNMTSGLPYGDMSPGGMEAVQVFEEMDERLYSDNQMSTMEFASKVAKCGLEFHPGEKWMYGTSADILGAVIEKITGMHYGEFLKKEIFEPLGMKDTGFYIAEDKLDRLADVYEKTADGIKLFETNHLGVKYIKTEPPAFESGGAGLMSTLDDYAKFATMLMQGGIYDGRRILKPATVEFMTTGKLTPWQQDSLWKSWESLYGYGYANLMRVMEEPGMAMFMTWKGEYGWDGWLGTYFCNSPSNKVTILMNCQRKDAGTMDVTKRIRNVITANIEDK